MVDVCKCASLDWLGRRGAFVHLNICPVCRAAHLEWWRVSSRGESYLKAARIITSPGWTGSPGLAGLYGWWHPRLWVHRQNVKISFIFQIDVELCVSFSFRGLESFPRVPESSSSNIIPTTNILAELSSV